MPIASKDEIKELNQIPSTDTSMDVLITKLISIVQDFVVRRINSFAVPYVYTESYNISFVSADKSINDENNGLAQFGLTIGNDILVQGSVQNNKLFTVASVSEAKITVNENVIDEEAGTRVIIQKIEFTEDIKLAVSDYILYRLNKHRIKKSYSLGDYSESGYNNSEMLEVFSSFRKLQWS
ncbi:MAG: hypothetical protein CVU92_03410 [Firmicutes bacterium HGW-Firmicutes-17]|jgi:hypothetical protein|nr:MAG: hypothetical protein CVU92_03410 [Firmicutes bacterium HGW-Firmicutes-17]